MGNHHEKPRRLVSDSRAETMAAIRMLCYGGKKVTQTEIGVDLGVSRGQANARFSRGFSAGDVIDLAESTDTNPVTLLNVFGFFTKQQVREAAGAGPTPERGDELDKVRHYSERLVATSLQLNRILESAEALPMMTDRD